MTMEAEKLLRVQDVAERLACGRSTVYKLVDEGALAQPVKRGRWLLSDVLAYLDRLRGCRS